MGHIIMWRRIINRANTIKSNIKCIIMLQVQQLATYTKPKSKINGILCAENSFRKYWNVYNGIGVL